MTQGYQHPDMLRFLDTLLYRANGSYLVLGAPGYIMKIGQDSHCLTAVVRELFGQVASLLERCSRFLRQCRAPFFSVGSVERE